MLIVRLLHLQHLGAQMRVGLGGLVELLVGCEEAHLGAQREVVPRGLVRLAARAKDSDGRGAHSASTSS